MTGTSTVIGSSLLPHGLHLSFVLLGVWGLAALLLPHALERRTARAHREPARDDHARRVVELRQAVVAGALPAPLSYHPSASPTPQPEPRREPALGVPLALVAGATAAGIHAAVAPPHLSEDPLSGVFFLVVAGVQLAWVAQLASRPRAHTLRTGIVLQASLVALWALTRVVGLPFGLLPEPHPVGGWDVTCVLWQLACVAACARALRDGVPARVPGWFAWHASTRAAVGAAAVLLALLTLLGAHS